MQYTKRNRHGDIGEHLVAFRVMKLLHWPCRLLNIDLGIDAEVEILSAEGKSTGDIIKLQVKSRGSAPSDGSFSINVSAEHIDYWTRFSAPLVFCGVCLETERVFCKHITSLGTYDTSGDSKKVTFCCEHDLLTSATAEKWRKFSSPPEAHKLRELMSRYDQLDRLTRNGAGDMETVQKYDTLLTEGESIAAEITKLVALMPWKITGVDLDNFYRIKRNLEIADAENAKTANELRFY